MTKINNKTGFPNVKYVAYILNDFGNGPLVRTLVNKKAKKFIKNVEQHFSYLNVERKWFPLLRSAFRDAPVFSGLVGPFLSVCPNTEKESLNYIQREILDALDCEHGHLLQFPSEVEEVIHLIIKGRSDYNHHRPLVIPYSIMQELRENSERHWAEYKRSGRYLDLKPVVKLYRADGAGTCLMTHMYYESSVAGRGLCHEGWGSTATKAIYLSELQDRACNQLFDFRIDESFVATKTIAEYAEEASASGQLLV